MDRHLHRSQMHSVISQPQWIISLALSGSSREDRWGTNIDPLPVVWDSHLKSVGFIFKRNSTNGSSPMGHLIVCPLDIFSCSFFGWRDVTQLDWSWFNLLSPNLDCGFGGVIATIIVLSTIAYNIEFGACLNNSSYVCSKFPNRYVGPVVGVKDQGRVWGSQRWAWSAWEGCGGLLVGVEGLRWVWRAWYLCEEL